MPVHETTRQALLRYARVRDRVHPHPKSRRSWCPRWDFASISTRSARFSSTAVQSIGIRTHLGRFGHGPRLHDLRHRLAVRTLVRWYRAGVDVERRLPFSRYLGHTKVTDTYWYLEAIPELLRLALARVERRRCPMISSTTFAGLLEAFFTDHLMRQRQVGPHTIVSYRETFRQLLRFAQDRLKKPPYQMSLEDLDAPDWHLPRSRREGARLVGAFA